MVICVDIGNSTIGVSSFKDDKIVCFNYFRHKDLVTKEDVLTHLETFKNIDVNEVEGIMYSSVVPEIDEKVIWALEKHFNKKVKRIDMKNPAIRDLIDIPSPDELGQDLVSDIIGGVSKYGYPLLIVDLGTASKVLYIDERGKFVNCNILPGLGLCRESLAKNASLLPKIELRVPETVLANNTIDAMNTGLVYGHAHMIEGIVSRYEQELNKKIKTVITGGYLNLLKPLFEKDFIIDFNLTMEGIYNIYKLEK